jgi:hypothetical protein
MNALLYLMACHRATACRAIPASLFTISHSQGGTAFGAGFTHISTKAAVLCDKFRAGQLQVSRRLADLRAVDHQPEMARFNMFTAGVKTMVHGGLQASLIAHRAGIDAGLHRFSVHCFTPGQD